MKPKACSTDPAPGPALSLLVLAMGRKAISVHRPEGNTIRLGRSSSSKIRVNDPHFPRFAGEVILRPTPLFRTPARGQGKGRLTLMRPGHHIPLRPYKLFLLEEGDVFRNRKRAFLKKPEAVAHAKPIHLAAGLMALMMIIAITGGGVIPHPRPGEHGAQEVTLPFEIKHQVKFTAAKPEVRNKVLKHIEAPAARPKTPQLMAARRHRSPTYMDETVFSRILKQAKKRLSEHGTVEAGKLITPLLPLLSTSQRDVAVKALNPYAEKIFKEAYILRPFSRVKSDRMMGELAQSGLDILPGVRKAKGINNATGHM